MASHCTKFSSANTHIQANPSTVAGPSHLGALEYDRPTGSPIAIREISVLELYVPIRYKSILASVPIWDQNPKTPCDIDIEI